MMNIWTQIRAIFLVCSTLLILVDFSHSQGRERSSLPPSGKLPPLQPPPGVEVTQDDINRLLQQPFEDDLTTPPWLKPKPLKPEVDPRVVAVRPEVIEEPKDPIPPADVRIPEIIEEPKTGPVISVEASPYAARGRAMREKKFMMLIFTGNEWNSVSNQLTREVFENEQFLNYAAENLVVCLKDCPSKMPGTDEPLGRLLKHFEIHGLPAFVLFDTDGNPYIKKSGYLKGHQDTYIAEVKVLVEQRRQQLEDRKVMLAENGFREWHNLEGKAFFGKVTSIEDGIAYFVDPKGGRAGVNISKLSFEDQKFLEE